MKPFVVHKHDGSPVIIAGPFYALPLPPPDATIPVGLRGAGWGRHKTKIELPIGASGTVVCVVETVEQIMSLAGLKDAGAARRRAS